MTTRHLVVPPELGLHRVSWRAQRGTGRQSDAPGVD